MPARPPRKKKSAHKSPRTEKSAGRPPRKKKSAHKSPRTEKPGSRPPRKKKSADKSPRTEKPAGRPPRKKKPGSRPPRKKRPAARPPRSEPHPEGERLQKVLAGTGAGSRRQCEELILTGRVEVDRQVVTELGTRVDLHKQDVRLDGVSLRPSKLVYFALHKPTGVVSTNRDPSGRPRVIDMLPKSDLRLYPVGRLDLNSEGLILVTNDGELANRLTHPRYGIEKTYRVQVAGQPTRDVLIQLRKGVRLAEGMAQVARVKITGRHKDSTILEIVLDEGRNRQIRRLLANVGHKVQRLVRIAVGPVRLATLPAGEHRRLTRQEIDALRKATAQPSARRKRFT